MRRIPKLIVGAKLKITLAIAATWTILLWSGFLASKHTQNLALTYFTFTTTALVYTVFLISKKRVAFNFKNILFAFLLIVASVLASYCQLTTVCSLLGFAGLLCLPFSLLPGDWQSDDGQPRRHMEVE